MTEPRIGVVGATGAVGPVVLELLAERGFEQVRAFASERSAGSSVPYGDGELVVEEATPEALGSGELDLCFFSVGTAASSRARSRCRRGRGAVRRQVLRFPARRRRPARRAGGERRGARRRTRASSRTRTARRSSSSCALAPLHEAAGLSRVRIATYQSASGAGRRADGALCGHRIRPRATSTWTGRSRATSSRRSRSSAPRRARSSSCPTCRSARRALGCR